MSIIKTDFPLIGKQKRLTLEPLVSGFGSAFTLLL
jgi:hypothetical protein